MNNADQTLLNELKVAGEEVGYDPSALVRLAKDAARWKQTAIIPNFGPFPTSIDEADIDQASLATWPDWVAQLVPVGGKWERLHWPDGTITIRLVNSRTLVLAAKHFPAARTEPKP